MREVSPDVNQTIQRLRDELGQEKSTVSAVARALTQFCTANRPLDPLADTVATALEKSGWRWSPANRSYVREQLAVPTTTYTMVADVPVRPVPGSVAPAGGSHSAVPPGVTCKGDILLGTACNKCQRCGEQRYQIEQQGRDLSRLASRVRTLFLAMDTHEGVPAKIDLDELRDYINRMEARAQKTEGTAA